MSIQEMTDKQLDAYRQELLRRERSPATITNYIRHCEEVLQFCQDGLKAAPNQEMLLNWKHTLLTAGLCPATINAKLAAVNGFLRFLGRPELCVRQVRRQRRVFRDKDRDLSRGEYLRLV